MKAPWMLCTYFVCDDSFKTSGSDPSNPTHSPEFPSSADAFGFEPNFPFFEETLKDGEVMLVTMSSNPCWTKGRSPNSDLYMRDLFLPIPYGWLYQLV